MTKLAALPTLNFSSIHQKLDTRIDSRISGITLQFFENKKEYELFVKRIQKVIQSKQKQVLQGPFACIKSADMRPVKLIRTFSEVQEKVKHRMFNSLYSYSVKRQKNLFQLRRMCQKVKKRNMRKSLKLLKYYFYSQRMVLKNLHSLHRALIEHQRKDLVFFFDCFRVKEIKIPEIESGMDYEIEISATDCELDSNQPRLNKTLNIFAQEDSGDSKEISSYLEASQGNSREDPNNRQSNFNTFFNQDKDVVENSSHPTSLSKKESIDSSDKSKINRLLSFGQRHFNLVGNTFSDSDLRKSSKFSHSMSAPRGFTESANQSQDGNRAPPDEPTITINCESLSPDVRDSPQGNSQVFFPRDEENGTEEPRVLKESKRYSQNSEEFEMDSQRDALCRNFAIAEDDPEMEQMSAEEKDDFLDIVIKKNSVFTYRKKSVPQESPFLEEIEELDPIDFEFSPQEALPDARVRREKIINSPERLSQRFISFSNRFKSLNKFLRSSSISKSKEPEKPEPKARIENLIVQNTPKSQKSSQSRVKNLVTMIEKSKSQKKIVFEEEDFAGQVEFFQEQKESVAKSTVLNAHAQLPKRGAPLGESNEHAPKLSKAKGKPATTKPVRMDQKFANNMILAISVLLKYLDVYENKNVPTRKRANSSVLRSKKDFFEKLINLFGIFDLYFKKVQSSEAFSGKMGQLKQTISNISKSMKQITNGDLKKNRKNFEIVNFGYIRKILIFLKSLVEKFENYSKSMCEDQTQKKLLLKSTKEIPKKENLQTRPVYSVRNIKSTKRSSDKKGGIVDASQKAKKKPERAELKKKAGKKSKNESINTEISLLSRVKRKKPALVVRNFVVFLNVKLKLKMKRNLEEAFDRIGSVASFNPKSILSSRENQLQLNEASINKVKPLFRLVKKNFQFKLNLAFKLLQSYGFLSNRGKRQAPYQTPNNQNPADVTRRVEPSPPQAK